MLAVSRLAAIASLAQWCASLSIPTSLKRATDVIKVGGQNLSAVIPEAFVSFSIEFAFFPDFAGNTSHPNHFSNNLLNSIADYQGTKPYIRVGGNTQDYAVYNASLAVATNGTYIPSVSTDYPRILYIGPSYFESYGTWPNTKFIHGFNLGHNSSTDRQLLLDYVPLVCRALSHGNLLYWEYGNEPDLYKTSAQGPVRPPWWNEQDYVNEWLNGTRNIRAKMKKACPKLATDANYKYIAPSFAGTSNSLQPVTTWQDGLDMDKDIAQISSHNYIGGATQPGVTLQGTLMNHTRTVLSLSSQLNESAALRPLTPNLPFILGETNSLYNEGAPGLSNSFGAALWSLDFNLYSASHNISRTHMHMGTDYRYASWQPLTTAKTTKGTKAPYYGNIAVAAMLGDLTDSTRPVQLANLPVPADPEYSAAYAAYVGGALTRLAVINLREFNYTGNEGATARPSRDYAFRLPHADASRLSGGVVRRLMANGSDAVTGISFDGFTFNWEVAGGRPSRMGNVTRGEAVVVGNGGVVSLEVPYSSAAIVDLVYGF